MSQPSLTLPATGTGLERPPADAAACWNSPAPPPSRPPTSSWSSPSRRTSPTARPASRRSWHFGGFLLGAILLIAAVLPVLPTSTLVLMPVALVLNVVLGQLMGATGLPFYLDAIGTVLIAVLAGPPREPPRARSAASCGPSSTRPSCPSPPAPR